jgi:hypothetical protein
MPDFLHSGGTVPTPPAPESPRTPGPPAGPLPKDYSRRPGVATPASPQRKGSATDAPSLERKAPSRLLTDYYPALFLLIVGIFIAAGFIVLRPLIMEYKMTHAEINVSVETLKAEREYLQSLHQSIAAAEAIPPETLASVNEALPREIGVPKLLQTMAVLAAQDRVRLSNVQFTPPKMPGPAARGSTATSSTARGVTAQPVDMSLTLSSPGYANTRRFLESLERNVRILDIQAIAVAGNEQSGELTYTVNVRTYALTKK